MHRRQHLRAPLASAAVALLGVGGLVACAHGVDVAVPPQGGSAACTNAARSWPATIGTSARVATRDDNPAVRAWGDPAIIARCGVSPVGPTTQQCLTVDGVDWVVRRLADGVQAITYGRDPAIEVLVPGAYAPEPLLLPAFTDVAKALPSTGRRCVAS